MENKGLIKKALPVLGKLLVLGIFCLAIFLLHRELRKYNLMEIRRSLGAIPVTHLLLSFCLMLLNYWIMVGYDGLALKAIHKKLDTGKVYLVSFTGCVISYNFGALLGGSTVRYRLYTAWGFTPLDVLRLVLMLAVTFWIGALGLAGGILLFFPADIPADLNLGISDIRPLGAFLLCLTLLYLFICYRVKGKPFHIRGREFALPPLHIAIMQTLVAGADLVAAAACLYALLPHQDLSFMQFLPGYLMAQITVVLTHVPGGMGVLEVIILHLTPNVPQQAIFAALLSFRVIYYLLPLLMAAIMLGLYELHLRRGEADSLIRESSRWFRAWVPEVMSYAVFVAGAILCLSIAIPSHPRKILFLLYYLPPWLMAVSQIITAFVGVLLLFLASGLRHRRRSVWRMVVAALCVGVISSLGKGGDVAEAVMLLIFLFPLLSARRSFGRIAPFWKDSYPPQWILAAFLVVACTGAVGFALYHMMPGAASRIPTLTQLGDYSRIAVTVLAESLGLVCLTALYAWKHRAYINMQRQNLLKSSDTDEE